MEAGRPFVGKVVYDLMRAVDLLRNHPQVDPARIGCAGSSLGGTVTQFLAAVDDRISLCLNSAWTADYRALDGSKGCCYRVPRLFHMGNQSELIALGAPTCAYLILVGELDEICPPLRTREIVDAAKHVYELFGASDRCALVIRQDAGHQPYHLSPVALDWLCRHFNLDDERTRSVRRLPTLLLGEYADRCGIEIDALYNVPRHHRGGVTVDINAVHRPPEELRVLTGEERHHGPYSLESWLRGVERVLPHLPSSDGELRHWIEKRETLRQTLHDVLSPGPQALTWSTGEEGKLHLPLPPGTTVWNHALGLSGFAASLIIPSDGDRSGQGVIFQPAGRSKDDADPDLLVGWLEKGDAVVVLDAVGLNDNELLAGTSATAFNVRLVQCAVDGLLARSDISTVVCRSEIDDVSAWSIAIDPRIDVAEVHSRGGVEPSQISGGRYRREGVVPGYRQWTDLVGLWAMAAPREIRLAPGVAEAEEEERLHRFWSVMRTYS